MKKTFVLLFMIGLGYACQSPKPSPALLSSAPLPRIGGPCESCELMYQGIPEEISAVDTSLAWYSEAPQIKITGRTLQLDGRTPAANVLLYYWQTDAQGYYAPGTAPHQNTRHGKIRGWVKSDANGEYTIYTARPGAYPGRSIPAHIHVLVKEPHLEQMYYIDDWVFDDDRLVNRSYRQQAENRGGTGVLRAVVQKDGVQLAEDNIILGLHIPHHPANLSAESEESGRAIGEDVPSFTPYHAYGPDRGTRTCPVCKFGRFQGVLYFVPSVPDWAEVEKWLQFLEQESLERKGQLKVYLVYAAAEDYDFDKIEKQLFQLGEKLGIKALALTFVPSVDDQDSEIYHQRIRSDVQNTFIVYRQSTIVEKRVDYSPSEAHFADFHQLLDDSWRAYLTYPAFKAKKE